MIDMKTIGLLTIGQSPRTDVTPSLKDILGDKISVVERGALDRLADDELVNIAPTEHEETYISRLRNGQSVKISKEKLIPLLQEELKELEKQSDMILMLCTGDFPMIYSTKLVLYPDKLLTHTVQAIIPQEKKLGLIIPLEEQRSSLSEKWKDSQLKLKIEVASPYDKNDIFDCALRLKEKGVSAIVLDCMGYNEEQKKEVKNASNLPVILPRTLVARILKEFVAV